MNDKRRRLLLLTAQGLVTYTCPHCGATLYLKDAYDGYCSDDCGETKMIDCPDCLVTICLDCGTVYRYCDDCGTQMQWVYYNEKLGWDWYCPECGA